MRHVPLLLLSMLMTMPVIAQEPAVAFTVKVGLMPIRPTKADKMWDAVEAIPHATVVIVHQGGILIENTDSEGLAKFKQVPIAPYTVAVGNIKGRRTETFPFEKQTTEKKVLVALGRRQTII